MLFPIKLKAFVALSFIKLKAFDPLSFIDPNALLAISDIGLPLVKDMNCELTPLDKDLNTPSPASIDLLNPLVNGVKKLPTFEKALFV